MSEQVNPTDAQLVECAARMIYPSWPKLTLAYVDDSDEPYVEVVNSVGQAFSFAPFNSETHLWQAINTAREKYRVRVRLHEFESGKFGFGFYSGERCQGSGIDATPAKAALLAIHKMENPLKDGES